MLSEVNRCITLKAYYNFYNPMEVIEIFMYLNTNINDWRILLRRVIDKFEYRFYIEGEEQDEIKLDIGDIFKLRNEELICLVILVNGKQLNTYFFDTEQIEFDISPNEIKGEQDIKDIIKFMKFIGSVTRRSVCLTLENSPETIVLRIDGNGKTEKFIYE